MCTTHLKFVPNGSKINFTTLVLAGRHRVTGVSFPPYAGPCLTPVARCVANRSFSERLPSAYQV
jgi:hypothetical protein